MLKAYDLLGWDVICCNQYFTWKEINLPTFNMHISLNVVSKVDSNFVHSYQDIHWSKSQLSWKFAGIIRRYGGWLFMPIQSTCLL